MENIFMRVSDSLAIWREKEQERGDRERGRERQRERVSVVIKMSSSTFIYLLFLFCLQHQFFLPPLLCLSLFLLLLRCLLLLRLRPHSLRLPIHKNKIQQNPIAIEFESSRIESNLLYNEVDVDNGDASSDVDGDVDSAVSRRLCLVDFHSHSLSLFDCLLLLSALLLLLLSSLISFNWFYRTHNNNNTPR